MRADIADFGGAQYIRSRCLLHDSAPVPRIFEQDGYRFFFYSNEHRPIHVHVRYGGGEAVFDVDPVVELRESVGLRIGELSHAQELAPTSSPYYREVA